MNGVVDLMNCEAHFMLAYYYYKLAVDIPNLIEGIEPEEENGICCKKFGYYLGLVFNGIAPIFTAITLGACLAMSDSRPRDGNGKPTIPWNNTIFLMYYLQLGGSIFISLLQSVSGIMLMWSINRIRVYLGKTEDDGGVNVKAMITHAFAFGFYLLAVLANVVTFILYLSA
jgi:hypothetical protein